MVTGNGEQLWTLALNHQDQTQCHQRKNIGQKEQLNMINVAKGELEGGRYGGPGQYRQQSKNQSLALLIHSFALLHSDGIASRFPGQNAAPEIEGALVTQVLHDVCGHLATPTYPADKNQRIAGGKLGTLMRK